MQRQCAGVDKVFVADVDAMQSMELVRELRAKGLVQGKDFDFAYQQAKYDYFSSEVHQLKGCTFTFKDSKWATFFRIKYG